MKKYFIFDDSGNQQGPYSENVLQVLHEEGSIRSDTRIREIHSSELGTYSDIAAGTFQDKQQKDMDDSSYLIALEDGGTEGPYTKKQIKALYSNGRLEGTLLCCKTGTSAWDSIETLIGKNSQQSGSPEISGGVMEGNIPSLLNEENESSRLMPEIPPTSNISSPLRETTLDGHPLQDERSTPFRHVYNMRKFWDMTMLYISSLLLIIIAATTYAVDIRFTSTILGILYFWYALILLLINTWKAWKCIQPIVQYGRRIPSAGKAVGLLFVPFFNLYWMYVCFVGLVDNASWLARVSQKPSLRLNAWPMFAFVLFSQLPFGGCIITGAIPESRPFFNILPWLWLPWPIAVFWYTERIIQSFPRPQGTKRKSS